MEKIKVNIDIFNSDEEIEKMYQEYLACSAAVKEIKRLGIPEDKVKLYIVKIYDFVDDINHCKKCPGVKNCKKNNPLLCTKLNYEHGVVDRELVPCNKILESVKIESKFIFKDYDEKFNNVVIADIDDAIKAKKDIIMSYYAYHQGKSDKWIFIKGEASVGKSMVAAALANSFARDKEGEVGFINTAFRFREMTDYAYNDKELFEDMIDSMSNCPFLVIDGLGNEYKTDFVRDGILYRILSSRASKNLMTVITSDFSIDDIVDLYDTSRAAGIRARQMGKIIKSRSTIFDLSTSLKGLYQ